MVFPGGAHGRRMQSLLHSECRRATKGTTTIRNWAWAGAHVRPIYIYIYMCNPSTCVHNQIGFKKHPSATRQAQTNAMYQWKNNQRALHHVKLQHIYIYIYIYIYAPFRITTPTTNRVQPTIAPTTKAIEPTTKPAEPTATSMEPTTSP